VDTFKEQARGLIDGGCDLIVIETMIDIQERAPRSLPSRK